MEVSVDLKSDLVTNVADVRHTPLGRLAQAMESADGRVLRSAGAPRATFASFNSSI